MIEKKLSKRRQKVGADAPTESVATSMTFEKALEVFLLYQDAARHSKATQKDYYRVLTLFIRYMHDVHQYTVIDQVTESEIIEWMAHLRNTQSKWGKPYSSRSIQTYIRDVGVFFNWLTEHKHLTVNPMGLTKPPKTDKALIRVFTEDELERLDAACERASTGKSLTPDERKALASRDRAFLWLLLSTGIRMSEACGLLFSDIDWQEGMIYVRGKGAKERRVPIGKVARQHLNTYIQYWRGTPAQDTDEHIFLNAFGDPLSQSAAQRIFVRLKEIAGIKDKRVSAHTCRHWFAVNSIKNGMPSVALQALLGHEQLEMINTYVRLAEQDNRELYVKFSPVDSLDMHQRGAKGRREELRDWRNARKKANRKKGD
jgi:site-specific recombinase XerD